MAATLPKSMTAASRAAKREAFFTPGSSLN
jgi:hypothetical protein